MIPIKTSSEIKLMKKSGRILTQVFIQVAKDIKPGASLIDLEKKANQLILKNGAKPSFKMVDNYGYATCLNINEGIVHGIPGKYQIKNGDLVTLDMGVCYQGWNTDMARTLRVRNQLSTINYQLSKEIDQFLKVGRTALSKAISQARSGNHVGHISQEIQQTVEKAGYSVVRTLTGHGVGRKLHEPPVITCFLKDKIKNTPMLKSGMTLAIEIIYAQGKPNLIHSQKDPWTLKTADGKLSALFENTVLVTKNTPSILTDLEKATSLARIFLSLIQP